MIAPPIEHQKPNIEPFRRRIAALRAWKWMSISGSICMLAIICAVALDRFDIIDLNPELLPVILAAGLLIGAAAALLRKNTDQEIARSIDRRSTLDDRLTTIYELFETGDGREGEFVELVTGESRPMVEALRPSDLYPVRFGKLQFLFLALLLCAFLLYLALNTTLLLSPSSRADRQKLARQGVQIEQVVKPFLKQADQPTASAEDKQLAKEIRRFVRDLQKAHLSKQEALVRANQLAAEAKQIEEKKNLALGQAITKAQTAGEKLTRMAQDGSVQKSDEAKLADKESAMQQKMDALQNELKTAMAGKPGAVQSAAVEKIKAEMAATQKALQQLKVSEAAAAMMSKLEANPDYQKAMDLLSKLQQANQAQPGSQSQMSAEQMKQIADQLDQLAKQLNTDGKLRDYAKALLDAAKDARAGNSAGLSAAIASAAGLDPAYNNSAPPDYGENGTGSTSPGTWVGDHGKLNRSDKSSLLHIKFSQHDVTSQIGHNGPSTYEEEMGPAQMGAKSGIPYQAVLPKYEKSAESALSKGDVPPEMRAKVRDYFDSLHQSQ